MNKATPEADHSVDAAYNRVVEMCETCHANLSFLVVHLDRLLGADRHEPAPTVGGESRAQPASGVTANAPPHLWLLHDQLSTLNGMIHRTSDQLKRLERI